jgi:O-antigen/teichoic acid export membrane protein
MTGTTIAQAIPIAISPILTRIYTPEDFGVFALFLSLVSIFSVVATGRYELAIMLPHKDENAIYIAILAIMISFVITILLFLIFWKFNQKITNLLGNEDISIWLYWIPISIFLTSIYQSLNFLNIRSKYYKNVATSKVLQSATLSLANISIGYSTLNKIGLISGQMIGQLVASIYLIYITYTKKIFIFQRFNKLKIFSLAKRYREFPKIVTLTGVLNTASVQAPIIMLTSLFSLKIVGFYSFAERILALPISLLGASIGQVFFQEMSKIKSLEERARLFKITLWKLLKIASPIFAFILIFGDKLFALIFGAEWIIAGEYAQVMSLWLFLIFLISPLTQVYNILEKQRLFLKLNFLGFILRITSLLIGGVYFKEVMTTLYLFVGSGVFIWILILYTILSFLKIDIKHILLNIAKYFIRYTMFFYLLNYTIGVLL